MAKVAQLGKYCLEHTIVEGPLGEPQDYFEITWIETRGKNKGMMFHSPVATPLRAITLKSDSMFPPLKPWSLKERYDILANFLKNK